MDKSYKILIIDKDGVSSRSTCDFFNANGFEAKEANTGEVGIETMKVFKPHFVVCDLTLPDMNGIDVLDYVRGHSDLSQANMKIMIMSKHNNHQNVRTCIQKGASDYIIKPLKPELLLPRVIFQAQKRREVKVVSKVEAKVLQGADFYLHLMSLVLKEASSRQSDHEVLFNMTKMLAMTLNAVRCSVIECADDGLVAFVRASQDDIKINSLRIDMERYPEIADVMNKQEVVVIENLDSDPILSKIKTQFKNIMFNAMIVCPVYKRGNFYGVLSSRTDNKKQSFTEEQIQFAVMMSQVVSLILSSHVPLPLILKHSA